MVVISAGFAEVGAEGAERQRELLEVCREGGMRLVGPNCLGIINTAADVRLNATFAPRMPDPGNVGFVSQSGALGLAFIELSGDRNLGLSSFASVGNRADITANDLLEYWESDPAPTWRCSISSRSAIRGAFRGWRPGSAGRSRSSS